jgi:hypothetical protein
MDDNKRKALTSALSQIEKQFGKGAIMRMGDRVNEAIETVSTGSLGLDIALGVGGLPRGRVVEIYGPESSTPSTRSIRPTPKNSASRSMTCWCRSRIPASRRWKSLTCWCARAPSTWWWSTRWPR